MNKFRQFFQEENGQYSATRLAFLAWVLGTLIVWSASSFSKQEMQDLPSSVQVLIGVLMTGKVAQKFREERTPTPSRDKPTTENDVEPELDLAGNGLATTSVRQN